MYNPLEGETEGLILFQKQVMGKIHTEIAQVHV